MRLSKEEVAYTSLTLLGGVLPQENSNCRRILIVRRGKGRLIMKRRAGRRITMGRNMLVKFG